MKTLSRHSTRRPTFQIAHNVTVPYVGNKKTGIVQKKYISFTFPVFSTLLLGSN